MYGMHVGMHVCMYNNIAQMRAGYRCTALAKQSEGGKKKKANAATPLQHLNAAAAVPGCS
jgi:hypothetical protein